ncbi:conserved exported protein of unknown function [Magnetospirillum gryphiswaldense MSR-1 v2]|uniref:Porin domain-containing protein n=1 Tax=Magnetospirillum gryphiswaldense (strain DSM 6361 / JCM 21280 / NBRC 15271 / MSR-1) TaxID=431944 RepID=V6EY25_MAGGM|nr:conserved exported protein of unknown function [Magnetospirillum gryphiswaldense MSR-1 v2]
MNAVKGVRISLLLIATLITTPVKGALSSEKIQLRLGGYSKWWLVGQWSGQSYQKATNAVDNADVKGDNEVHLSGSTTLDNGMVIGIKTEIEAGGHTTNSTDTADKAFVWISSGLGKIILGTDYNAASQVHVCAPEAAGAWNGPSIGLMSDRNVPRPSAVSTMYSGNQTELTEDDNADKLIYLSPSLHGVSLAASYTPSSLSEDNALPPRNSGLFALGLGYNGTAGPWEISASAGYAGGDLNSSGATNQSFQAFSVGAQIGRDGWTFGGSLAREDHRYQGPISRDDSGYSWDVGLMRKDGPTSISVNYYQSLVQGQMADPGQDRITVQQISAKHMLGDGMALMGAAGRITYDDEAAGPANHNTGYSLMTGMGIWF